jgi:hypothetical protein
MRYRPELEDAEVKDGEGVRVDLADANEAVRSYMRATDAVAAAQRYMAAAAGHRPMAVRDALALSSSVRVNDTALDLARAMRDQAFEDLCKRSENA